MDILQILTEELQIARWQTENTVALIDEGNTIPFIARYRKEKTGSLNDEVLRNLYERLTYLRNLEEKKQQVIASIREQGKLTPALEQEILKAATQVAVEDLYRPYRPKRRTRATIARERGLEPLAELLWQQKVTSPEKEAAAFCNPEKEVPDTAAALAGASDILAERVADDPQIRARVREMTMREAFLVTSSKDTSGSSVYEMYYNYEEAVKKIPGHRILAINRGEKEKVLSVRLDLEKERILEWLNRKIIRSKAPAMTTFLQNMLLDAYSRLLAPAIERDIRNELTEKAEDGAITVFGKNLTQLLMQPPIAGRNVLGWDPAFRTGCKLAVVDATGKVLDTVVVYPTAPTNAAKIRSAMDTVEKLIKKYHISLISLGNGTASRESEAVIVDILKEIPEKVSYIITNEAGASVYSASKLATEEFPHFDVGQRSAASIARRVQDPLAELVKIDPKAIGVGQYQHDMNQKKLGEALEGVVEDCVNRVGVDVNTASAPLLAYISGISKTVAKNIVQYREDNGRFMSRRELLKVPKLGPKAYEQCAGFLRITGGKEPLDMTGIHPESYEAARKLLKVLHIEKDFTTALKGKVIKIADYGKMAVDLGIGEPTLRDIVGELNRPGRDPREDMPAPILRSDVLAMEDLKEGMLLKGTVRNVIDFGAFVDIGVHQDGLVHISQMSGKYIKHPLEVVSIGDVVDVKVLSVDLKKKRISLTMRI